MKNYKGIIYVKELTGNLYLNSHRGEGQINLKKGSVAIDSYKGKFDLKLNKLTNDCKIDTHKGRIDLKIGSDQAVSVVKKSKKGRIVVDVKEGGQYKIEAKTYKGTIKIRK